MPRAVVAAEYIVSGKSRMNACPTTVLRVSRNAECFNEIIHAARPIRFPPSSEWAFVVLGVARTRRSLRQWGVFSVTARRGFGGFVSHTRCFVSVAENKSLSKAAREMFISQPAMTAQMNAL